MVRFHAQLPPEGNDCSFPRTLRTLQIPQSLGSSPKALPSLVQDPHASYSLRLWITPNSQRAKAEASFLKASFASPKRCVRCFKDGDSTRPSQTIKGFPERTFGPPESSLLLWFMAWLQSRSRGLKSLV